MQCFAFTPMPWIPKHSRVKVSAVTLCVCICIRVVERKKLPNVEISKLNLGLFFFNGHKLCKVAVVAGMNNINGVNELMIQNYGSLSS